VTHGPELSWTAERERVLARTAIGLVAAGVVIEAADIASHLLAIAILERYPQGAPRDSRFTDFTAVFTPLPSYAKLALLIPTAIVFLTWIRAAYGNLRLAGSGGTDSTPGWAVGCFLVPVVNLYRPYQFVRELWLRSADANAQVGRRAGEKGPWMVQVWWAALVYSGLTVWIGYPLSFLDTLEGLLVTNWILIGACLVHILAGTLVIRIILFVDRKQALFHGLTSYLVIGTPSSELSRLRSA
jgi:hypothetical protein